MRWTHRSIGRTVVRMTSPAPTTAQDPGGALVLATCLPPLLWGTTYVVTTLFLPADHALWSGVLRALPAGLLLLALSRTLPSGDWWWKAAVLGVLNIGAFFPLLFLAAYTLPGGIAAVFAAASPLVITALAPPQGAFYGTTGDRSPAPATRSRRARWTAPRRL